MKTIRTADAETRARFVRRVRELADAGATIPDAARLLDGEFDFRVGLTTVRDLASREGIRFAGTPADGRSPVERERDELRAALRRSQAALARAKARSEDLVAAVYKASRDAAAALGPPDPVPPPPRSKRRGKGRPEVALLHATDWQFGKRTESYDRAKCERRVKLLGEKVELLTNIQRAEHPVDRVVLMFGGDMLEGMNIFPGQAYEVDGTLFEQLFGVARLMTWLIRKLLSVFEVVEVYQEEGNHGRIGRRGDLPRTDNTDMMAYEITRQRFENEPRVVWHPRRSWYQLVEIGAYRAMLVHGDEIKSFGGNTPAFGLLRKGTAWSSGVTDPFHDIYFGHFHTHMSLTLPNGGTMYGTGSIESDNAYAAEFVAAKGKPSQRLHYVDPRRGRVTCEYKVYLDDGEVT